MGLGLIAMLAIVVTFFWVIQLVIENTFEYILYFVCFVAILMFVEKVIEYFTCDREELLRYKDKKQDEELEGCVVGFGIIISIMLGVWIESIFVTVLLFTVVVIVLIPLGKYLYRKDTKEGKINIISGSDGDD